MKNNSPFFAKPPSDSILLEDCQFYHVQDIPGLSELTKGSFDLRKGINEYLGHVNFNNKTVLELGGADPFIVMEDANLSNAVDAAVKGRMLNNGQSCIAAKRFIVHSSVYDEFLSGLQQSVKKLIIGDPMMSEAVGSPLGYRRRGRTGGFGHKITRVKNAASNARHRCPVARKA